MTSTAVVFLPLGGTGGLSPGGVTTGVVVGVGVTTEVPAGVVVVIVGAVVVPVGAAVGAGVVALPAPGIPPIAAVLAVGVTVLRVLTALL